MDFVDQLKERAAKNKKRIVLPEGLGGKNPEGC